MDDASHITPDGDNSKSGDGGLQIAENAAAEVEDPCPVCLAQRVDVSKIDGCDHTFCYTCISEWLKVSETCPLCKNPVNFVATNGTGKVKTISELKAEAESDRIMNQEVPMVTEREAVTHLLHLQRTEVNKITESKQKAKRSNAAANEQYRRETSRLTQLSALRDEMERISRRRMLGDKRFREITYELNLQWKPLSRPLTSIRINPKYFAENSLSVWPRVKPFIMRELTIILQDKSKLGMKIARDIFVNMQNFHINNPEFETVLMHTRLFILPYLETFCILLYEFCASGLDMAAFDANSSYCLDPSRAPSGRLIPSLLPPTSRTNDPIVIEGVSDDERGDDDVIIDGHRSDSSSNDSVNGLYNHAACRLPIRRPLLPTPFLPPPPPSTHPQDTIAQRLKELFSTPLTSIGGLLNPLQTGRPISAIGGPSTSNGTNHEVISIDDDSTPDIARINTIHDTDPSWLNVTGERASTCNGFSSSPIRRGTSTYRGGGGYEAERDIRNRLIKRRWDQFKHNRSNWKSWKADREKRQMKEEDGRSSREEKRKKEEKKLSDEEWMGLRIGSRKNKLEYYYEKINEGGNEKALERISADLMEFSRRIEELNKICRNKIEDERKAEEGPSTSHNDNGAVVVLDNEVSMQEDTPGPSTSDNIDSSIVIL